MGYEDFNFILETFNEQYFVKIFSSFRTFEDCKRYIEVIKKAIEIGVAIPKLFESKKEDLHIVNINGEELRLCVMEFINGSTIYELDEELTSEEIRFLSNQVALINSIKFKPKQVYDSWAITNFLLEYKKKSKFLSIENLELIKPLVEKFKRMKIEKLPHCFVHGDIIKTNVMKDKKGKLWIIDFSVSNYYPRIQELAVLSCNIFFIDNNKEKSEENLKIALEEYQKKICLTKEELKVLPTYIEFAHAMHLLSANYEKIKKDNNSRENEYWFRQGKIGLKKD